MDAKKIQTTFVLYFSLLKAKTEEELVQNKTGRLPSEVDLHEFARLLRLDDKEISTQQLFKIQDRVNRNFLKYLFLVFVIKYF